MKKFIAIVKQFAEWHPEMLHEDKKNKRFFLIRSIVAMPDFMATLPKNESPCVGFDMTPDCMIDGQKKTFAHTLYFLVKGGNGLPNDMMAEVEATEKGYELADTFRRWIIDHQQKLHTQGFRGIQIERERAYVMGPMGPGWMAVCLPVAVTESVSDQLKDFVDKPL